LRGKSTYPGCSDFWNHLCDCCAVATSVQGYVLGWKLPAPAYILQKAGLFAGLERATTITTGENMASEKQNLQDAFLNHVRKAKVPVTIFLINGVKLQGVITWFDNFCVLLRRDGQSQLVYKHAISTIMPGAPISLYEGDE
jgi:host factor-I protein